MLVQIRSLNTCFDFFKPQFCFITCFVSQGLLLLVNMGYQSDILGLGGINTNSKFDGAVLSKGPSPNFTLINELSNVFPMKS